MTISLDKVMRERREDLQVVARTNNKKIELIPKPKGNFIKPLIKSFCFSAEREENIVNIYQQSINERVLKDPYFKLSGNLAFGFENIDLSLKRGKASLQVKDIQGVEKAIVRIYAKLSTIEKLLKELKLFAKNLNSSSSSASERDDSSSEVSQYMYSEPEPNRRNSRDSISIPQRDLVNLNPYKLLKNLSPEIEKSIIDKVSKTKKLSLKILSSSEIIALVRVLEAREGLKKK